MWKENACTTPFAQRSLTPEHNVNFIFSILPPCSATIFGKWFASYICAARYFPFCWRIWTNTTATFYWNSCNACCVNSFAPHDFKKPLLPMSSKLPDLYLPLPPPPLHWMRFSSIMWIKTYVPVVPAGQVVIGIYDM